MKYATVCSALLSLVFTCSASAAITAYWQKNPISPAAIVSDPKLANMQSSSLLVSYTDGFWASAGLLAVLPPGNTYYRHPAAGNFRPTNAQQAANPALTYTTYITSPRQNTLPPVPTLPAILGGYPEGDLVSFGGPLDNIPGRFSVSWGDPQTTQGPSGPQVAREIARLTFPRGVFPFISDGSGGIAASQTSQVVPLDTTTIPQIPEPASIVSGSTMLLALTRRRR